MRFPSRRVSFFLEVEDSTLCGEDIYGVPKKCLVKKSSTMGNFQPMSSSEAQKEIGALVQGMYRLFIPVDTEVDEKYKVEVDGYEGYFQVKGEPIVRKSRLPQKKIILAREAKDDKAFTLPESSPVGEPR